MAQGRVALVTGGTRGIGAAISKGLQAKGYKVAANYGGNDEAAQAFKNETGIPVFILGWVEDKGHPLEVLHELAELLPTAQTTIAHTPEDVAAWPDRIGEFIRTHV